MRSTPSFPNHTIGSAPEEARPILEQAKQKFGMVPNLLARMASSPALLKTYWEASATFAESSLNPQEQQVVLLAVSVRNGCEYCVGAHSVIADMSNVPTPVTDALREGKEIEDSRLQALRRFTEQVVETRGYPSSEDTAAFLDAGFESRQILDVVLGVGMKTLSNYTNHIAGTELDEGFAHRAWKPAEVKSS